MGWKFAGVYIKNDFDGDPVAVLKFLEIDKRYTYERTLFANVVVASFEATAIGFKPGLALVHDNLLPYNNSYGAGEYSNRDCLMRDLTTGEIEILSFYVDDTSSSYGIAHFRNRQRVRHLSILGGHLAHQEGQFRSEESHPGDRVFDYLQQYTGFSFNSLVLDRSLEMHVFTETGF